MLVDCAVHCLVYLAAICLLHIEHNLPDPTDDSLLELEPVRACL